MTMFKRFTFKRLKKQTAAVLSFVLLLGLLNVWPQAPIPSAQAADSDWPPETQGGLRMPFRPTDSLVTTQNPPDFSWPLVSGADAYHLQVSRSPSMTDVVYENQTLTTNFYNFPNVFDPGTWYWQVRYHKPADGWSAWSTVRRFRIAEESVPFPVPPIDDIIGRVETGHPRIWTTPSELASFRALRLSGDGKAVYDKTYQLVLADLNKPLPAEPTFKYTDPSVPRTNDEFVAEQTKLRNYVEPALSRMLNTAFIYLVTGDASIGANAKAQLLNFASWDPEGATRYENQDQVHRGIAYRSAIAYDWLYDLLSEADKQEIREMIEYRTERLVLEFAVKQPIFRNPYDSHGWTIFGYIGIIATALLHDVPEAEVWYRQTVPAYINILPPWGGEDGSWSQGTGYWQWSSGSNKELMDVLLSSGAINLYDKAFSRNEGLYPLYMFPHGSPTGVFGNDSHYTPGAPSITQLNRLAQMYEDARLKWESEAIGSTPDEGLQNYFYGDETLGSRPPVDLPKGKWFPDTGVAAMHSDLYDRDRISLYFRSSPYGTYSHSMADQNSFIIHAFGEPLAVKSGFYDYYGSEHHQNYTKQTFSANAITFDGKKGQAPDYIEADGRLLGFASHPDFDAVSGDAKPAYNGQLTKALRHILYIRPSVYVVIDDVATAKAGGSEFEWNLHTDEQLDFDPDGEGATILKGDAGLKVRFYGSAARNYRTTYETKFLSATGVEKPPLSTSIFAGRQQIHAQFVTPKTNAAKMIATMEPYKRDGGAPQDVASAEFADYLKLTFEDGTEVYIRKTDSGVIDTGSDGYRFEGTALAVKGDSVLLVNGTQVTKNGAALIQSDAPSTIAYGKERLTVSAQADATVTLQAPGLTRLRDGDSGADIPSGGTAADAMARRGVYWTTAGGVLTLKVEKGQRNFKLNNVPVPGALPAVTLQTEIDGVAGSVTLQAYGDSEGVSVAWGKLANAAGFYEVLEAPDGFTFEKYGRISGGLLDANTPVILKGETGLLKLRSIGSGDAEQTVSYTNPEEARSTLSMDWQEAESFSQWGGKQPSTYTTRPFLSGGKGMGAWDQNGQWVKWKFNVPKAGTYDLIVKYVAGWDLPEGQTLSVRYLKIGNEVTYFEAPKTADFGTAPEVWRGLRVKTGQQLPAGPVEVTMWHQLGGMNLDWLALMEVKADEVRPTAPGNVRLVSQTDDSATVSWDPSTDNAAVKEYAVYVDGVRKLAVPFGTNTAAVPGLSVGRHALHVRAVDTSDNLSYRAPGAADLLVDIVKSAPPEWGVDASLRSELVFTDAVRLTWDSATDEAGGSAEYLLYREDVSATEPIATLRGTTYDVTGLQPGGTYTFRVQAKGEDGEVTGDGPDVTVTLPTVAGMPVYDSFDMWASGETADGNGWSYTKSNGTSVQVVSVAGTSGGKALQAVDNYHSTADEYATAPIMRRTTESLGGKVTVETRTMFSRVNHDIGNYTIDLAGSGKVFGTFVGFSDGGLGYQKVVNGNFTWARLTDYGAYKQPLDQWMKLRFDIDFAAKTYDLTVQADALKTYGGTVDPAGSLDIATGTYTVKNIPFLSGTSVISGFELFRVNAQRFTGKYAFDYFTMYGTDTAPSLPAPELRLESQTNDSATVGWDAAPNAAVKSHAIYVDGALKATVPAGTNTATVTGLAVGRAYKFTIRAVGLDDKPSPESRSLVVNLAGSPEAPEWGETAAMRADLLFKNAVRLEWDPATDSSGGAPTYKLYRLNGSAFTEVASVQGTSYDAADLQTGGTYTFKVEAVNASGGETTDGPQLTVTLLSTGNAVYDSFDTWTEGETADGDGWTYTKNNGTSVLTVALPGSGGKGLQAVDSFHSTADEYATGPILRRTMANLGGKVTFETRTMFSKVSHDVGNYTFNLAGNGKVFGSFVGFSDGGIGYQKLVNGAITNVRMTEFNRYKQPADQWMSIRYDIDFAARKYDLIVQADALKNYAGTVDPAGTLDAASGVYRVEGIPFLDASPAIVGMDLFQFYAQRFTGKYTFDYFAMYNTDSSIHYGENADRTAPTTTDDAPAGEFSKSDVTVNLTAVDDKSGVAATHYRVNGREPQTGNAVVLAEEGVHTIVYWSEDLAGNVEEERTATVRIDKTAPVSEAELTSAEPAGSAGWHRLPVTLMLSASDGLSGTSATEYRVNGGEWIPYDGSIPAFGEGVRQVDYRSIDKAGNVEPFKTVEIKVDMTAPSLDVKLDRTELWPANHKMVRINAVLESADDLSGVSEVKLVSIASSEPDSGDGDIDADLGTAAESFRLRAERSGGGAGRVYTVTYTVKDRAGNAATAVRTVTVPHNK